jgi:hypothetical protein
LIATFWADQFQHLFGDADNVLGCEGDEVFKDVLLDELEEEHLVGAHELVLEAVQNADQFLREGG